MDIHTNIPLKNYLTMKLGGPTRFMANASTKEDIATFCRNAKAQSLQVFVLGGGSNTIAHDETFNGIVIRNRIMGREIISDSPAEATVRFGAGENWDEAVQFMIEHGLSGTEAMSAIPGTIGAAPVQNIGAYGQELSDTFIELEAYDMETDQFVTLDADTCQFSYRSSIFRGEAAGRFAIVSVTLRLYKTPPEPPFYPAVEKYFAEHNITIFTSAELRNAVMAIRVDKLPDPAERPNSGSFFKNAIVEEWQLNELLKEYPDMPHYDLGNKLHKIPTGWLIEQTGLKGQLLHGVRVHDKNALVLINESATSFADLEAAREEVRGAVRDQFRITIEQEPLEI